MVQAVVALVDSLLDVLETTGAISKDQAELIYKVAVERAAAEHGEDSLVAELLRTASEERRVKKH